MINMSLKDFERVSEVAAWVKQAGEQLPEGEHFVIVQGGVFEISKDFRYVDEPAEYMVTIGLVNGDKGAFTMMGKFRPMSELNEKFGTFPQQPLVTNIMHMRGVPGSRELIGCWRTTQP